MVRINHADLFDEGIIDHIIKIEDIIDAKENYEDKVNEFIDENFETHKMVISKVSDKFKDAATHNVKANIWHLIKKLSKQTFDRLELWLVNHLATIAIKYGYGYPDDYFFIEDEEYFKIYYSKQMKFLTEIRTSKERISELEKYLDKHLGSEWQSFKSTWNSFKLGQITIMELFKNNVFEYEILREINLYIHKKNSVPFKEKNMIALKSFKHASKEDKQRILDFLKYNNLFLEDFIELSINGNQIIFEELRYSYKKFTIFKNPKIKQLIEIIEKNHPRLSKRLELMPGHDSLLLDRQSDIVVSYSGGFMSNHWKTQCAYDDPIPIKDLDLAPIYEKKEDILHLNKNDYRGKILLTVLKALDYPYQRSYFEIPEEKDFGLIITSDQGIECCILPIFKE